MSRRARAKRACAGRAGDAVIGADRSAEVYGLVDDEGDGLNGAGASDGGIRGREVGAELAEDVVERIGDEEVSNAVEGETAGAVEGDLDGGLAVLGGVVGAGDTAGESGDELDYALPGM